VALDASAGCFNLNCRGSCRWCLVQGVRMDVVAIGARSM
jgi:hypothetical protein